MNLTLLRCRPSRRARRHALKRWAIWGFAVAMLPAVGVAYEPAALLGFNNLSDLGSASTARTNLGLGTSATHAATDFLLAANNLSDVTAATARSNLGLGSIATQGAGAVAITGGTISGVSYGATTFTGILTTNSGIVRNVRVVTASGAVTAATTDDIIEVNKTSGAATTVNLFASPTTGTCLVVKDGKGDANTNNITVSPAAGNIDGAASFVMKQNYQSDQLCYDGTQWVVAL